MTTLAPEKRNRPSAAPEVTLAPEKVDRPARTEEPEFPADWYEEATEPWARWPDEMQQRATGLIIAGYALAVLVPIIGFIIGLTQITRNVHGIRVAWFAVAMMVVGVVVNVAMSGWPLMPWEF